MVSTLDSEVPTTDNDSHSNYVGKVACGSVSLINPDATVADLLAWACGEVGLARDLSQSWADLDGTEIYTQVPVSMLQVIFFRMQSTMKVLQRALAISTQAD